MKRILFVKEWLEKKRFEEMAQRLRDGEPLSIKEHFLRKQKLQEYKRRNNLS